MTGMAEVIAAHSMFALDDDGMMVCWFNDCGWRHSRDGSPFTHRTAHVAEELTKAGYGILPDVAPEYGARTILVNGLSEKPEPHGPNPNPSWFNKSTHVRLVGPWQELQSLPDSLATLDTPEGHALLRSFPSWKKQS